MEFTENIKSIKQTFLLVIELHLVCNRYWHIPIPKNMRPPGFYDLMIVTPDGRIDETMVFLEENEAVRKQLLLEASKEPMSEALANRLFDQLLCTAEFQEYLLGKNYFKPDQKEIKKAIEHLRKEAGWSLQENTTDQP